MKDIKLNWLQRGVFTQIFIFLVLTALTWVLMYLLDIINDAFFMKTLELMVQKNYVSAKAYKNIQLYLAGRDFYLMGLFTLIGMSFGAVALLIIRVFARCIFSKAITIPEALEWRPAFRKLGIISFAEEYELAKKHKIQIFIACEPFSQEVEEQKRAKCHWFAFHDHLCVRSIFEKHIGSRRLCITRQAYNYLLDFSEKNFSLKTASVFVEKDKEIEACNTKIAQLFQEIETLKNEEAFIKAENVVLKNKLRTEPAQDTKRKKSLRKERLQWEVILPVIKRLIDEAPYKKVYVKSELMEVFEKEWESRADLHAEMEALTESTKLQLSEAMMTAAKEDLIKLGLYSTKGGNKRT